MKIGDVVRVVALPQNLQGLPADTVALFTRCVGRSFPIVAFQQGDEVMVELEVGEVVGEPAFMHSIFIEVSCVEPVQPLLRVIRQSRSLPFTATGNFDAFLSCTRCRLTFSKIPR